MTFLPLRRFTVPPMGASRLIIEKTPEHWIPESAKRALRLPDTPQPHPQLVSSVKTVHNNEGEPTFNQCPRPQFRVQTL